MPYSSPPFDPTSPGPIGSTTPNTGSFTGLSSTTGITISNGTLSLTTPNLNQGFSFYNSNTTGGASIPLWLNSSSGGSLTNVSIENRGAGDIAFRTGATTLNGYGTQRFFITAAGSSVFNADLNSLGPFTAMSSTAIPAGGTAGAGLLVSATANFGVFFGSGVPTLTAGKGSLYLRSDGSGITNRVYVNTDGSTGWTNLVTAA